MIVPAAEAEGFRDRLEQSEAIVRSIGDGVYVLDRGGRLVWINPAAEELLGWRSEELRGRSMHAVIHYRNARGEQVAEKECPLLAVLDSGRVLRVDFDVFIRKDGQDLPVTYTSSPVLREGEVSGAVLVFRDISEDLARDRSRQEAFDVQMRAREAAQESERQYQALADFIPQQVWTARTDGALDYVNQQSLVFFDRSFDQIIGAGWQNVIHPDDLPPCLERWTHSLTTGDDYEVQFRLLRHDGGYRWHLGRATALRDRSGAIVRWLGTNTDIDARVREQDRAQILSQASALLGSSLNYEETLDRVAAASVPGFADGAFVHLFDDDGTLSVRSIHHSDPAMLEQLRSITKAYPVHEEEPFGPMHVALTGKPEMIAELDPAVLATYAHDDAHLRAIEALALRSFISVPLATRERTLGSMSFVVSRQRRAFDADSLAVATQLGERASLAIENALLYRRAEEAVRAKDEFLATLSHELRTPLTAMLGWARMMKMPGLDAATIAEAIESIEHSAEAQAELIEDVLDTSRITTGKLSLDLKEVALSEIVATAVETLRPSAFLREVALESRASPDPIKVAADPNRLRQIIWNLLSNAIKFTPKQGHVTVHCHREGSNAVLSVTDDGRGISRELLPHVFEAFRQADSSSTRSSSGLGLGLAIVSKLVELHGGTIRAESEGLGRGSVFTLTLPVARKQQTEQEPVDDQPAAREDRVPAALPDLRGIDVLVVDDNPHTLRFIEALLSRCAAVVRTASSVDDALRLVAQKRPDVLLSDVAMPDRDGYSLIQEVARLEGPRIPTVALTAFGRPSEEEVLLAAGFDRYLKKPFEPAALAVTVRELAVRSHP